MQQYWIGCFYLLANDQTAFNTPRGLTVKTCCNVLMLDFKKRNSHSYSPDSRSSCDGLLATEPWNYGCHLKTQSDIYIQNKLSEIVALTLQLDTVLG